jgi:hypothetical protein
MMFFIKNFLNIGIEKVKLILHEINDMKLTKKHKYINFPQNFQQSK